MPRYIDADVLTVAAYDAYDDIQEINDRGVVISEKFRMLIDAQPTADAVERKRGKWIEEIGMLMCSECGDAWGTEQFDEVMSFNYCPNCGSLMKGEDDGI